MVTHLIIAVLLFILMSVLGSATVAYAICLISRLCKVKKRA